MRFNNVDVERAYSDYLDSLEDWPPPAEDLSAELVAALARTNELSGPPARTPPLYAA